MSTSSSLQEKEVEWQLQDQEASANKPVQYEPIRSEPLETKAVEEDLEANAEKRSTRGNLSRLQSSTSGISEFSDVVSSTRSTTSEKQKWYKKANPLRWGAKPPVPKTRDVSREYHASSFSRLTFHWISPLMTVCLILVVYCFMANVGISIGWLQTAARAQRYMDSQPGPKRRCYG
jgi:ATP-binding cassette subfamily C (CFTR/MRP) protein 1